MGFLDKMFSPPPALARAIKSLYENPKNKKKSGPKPVNVMERLAAQTGGRSMLLSGPGSQGVFGGAAAPPPPPSILPSFSAGSGGGGGMSGQQWLDMALAALGGGPDRSAYVSPFEQAMERARGANAQALPQIAQNYDRLRGELGQSQQVVNRDAEQARANMAATQQQLQGQVAQNAAPVLADLASQGNTPALGGLLGAAQAQVGTGQAQLAQQAATQQQLSGNMQQASTASHNSRVADSQLAQGAATSNANNTLNSVLAQLDAKKAQALQQYSQDAQQHGSKVAQLRMEAMERDQAANDPMRAMELALKQADLEDRMLDLDDRRAGPQGGDGRYRTALNDFQIRTAEQNPVAWSLLSEFLSAGGEQGVPMGTLIANLRNDERNKNGKIRYKDKNIDVNWMIQRARELDELERAAQREEEEGSSSSRRKRR